MALTELEIRAAKAVEKPLKLFDGGGLYLLVTRRRTVVAAQVATSRAERDITADLRGALTPAITKNRAAVTDPAAIAALLRAIDGYCGQPVTHAALRLAPLVFVRPGELRQAEWSNGRMV